MKIRTSKLIRTENRKRMNRDKMKEKSDGAGFFDDGFKREERRKIWKIFSLTSISHDKDVSGKFLKFSVAVNAVRDRGGETISWLKLEQCSAEKG